MHAIMIPWLGRHHRKLIIIAALSASLSLAGLLAAGLREQYTIASFVGSRNAEFETLEAFVRTFGGQELALIAVSGSSALAEDTLSCMQEMVHRCEALPAVQRAGAISKVPRLMRAAWLDHPLVEGVLIGHDRRTAAIILQMRQEAEAGDLRKQTVADLRGVVEFARLQYPELQIILSGPYVTMLEMFDFVRQDLKVFSICVAALMLVVLYLLVGSWQTSVFAIGVAVATVLCTLGLTIVVGVNMSLTTQMIVIMVAILAVATCVHLAVGHREVMVTTDPPPVDPGGATLRNLGRPCTAVLLTSAAGFGSVCISDIQPIRDFGWLMVVGLLLALVLSFSGVFVLPIHAGGARDPRRRFHERLGRWLERLAGGALRHKSMVLALFLISAVALAVPIPQLKFESDFVRNFRSGSAVRLGYEFIERHLAPLGSIELVVEQRSPGSIINLHAVRACDEVARQAVQRHDPIRKAVSIVDVLALAPGDLPDSQIGLQLQFEAAKRLIAMTLDPEVLSNFVTTDLSMLRLSLRAREGADVQQKLDMAHDIGRLARQTFGEDYRITVTGLYYFYATLIAGLLRDQNRTFLITLIVVCVFSAVALRSWKLALIGLVPNLFPMIACLGMMGWLRIPINMATSMMLAIALGIAVDDTIHYLHRFRKEMMKGENLADAIARSHRSVGQACVFTTLVITGGFWILCFSRFLPTAYFGALIGVTMLIALAADLILLPVLLRLLQPLIPAVAQSSTDR